MNVINNFSTTILWQFCRFFSSFFPLSFSDVNCVQEVQNKCENSEAPFEVLVQGPSGNRFVRSLVLADGSEAELEAVDPKHVSTFSIYQPKHLVKRDIEADIAEAVTGTREYSGL